MIIAGSKELSNTSTSNPVPSFSPLMAAFNGDSNIAWLIAIPGSDNSPLKSTFLLDLLPNKTYVLPSTVFLTRKTISTACLPGTKLIPLLLKP